MLWYSNGTDKNHFFKRTNSLWTCVSRVHGDENSNSWVERYLSVLKREHSSVHRKSVLDGRQLRRNHGKDRDVDPVEFVEAAPGAALAQSREYLAHHLVVHAFAAVGDDTQKTERFRQVLGRLRLSSASRSSWSTAELHGQSLGEGEVDAVRQRCDDQSPVETHVFVAITELARALANYQLVGNTLPVKPERNRPFS